MKKDLGYYSQLCYGCNFFCNCDIKKSRNQSQCNFIRALESEDPYLPFHIDDKIKVKNLDSISDKFKKKSGIVKDICKYDVNTGVKQHPSKYIYEVDLDMNFDVGFTFDQLEKEFC